MNTSSRSYYRHRVPTQIMIHAVWLYHWFCLIFREVEELIAERGITVTYETIRHSCQKFWPDDENSKSAKAVSFGSYRIYPRNGSWITKVHASF